MHIYRGSHIDFSCTQFFFVDTCRRNYQIVSKLSPFCCRWPRHPRRPLPRLSLQLVRTRYDARTWWVGELHCECRLNHAISSRYGGSHPCTPVPALPWRFEAAVCRQVPFEAAIVGGGGGENERVADFGEGEKGAENLADIVAVQRGAIEHFGSAT